MITPPFIRRGVHWGMIGLAIALGLGMAFTFHQVALATNLQPNSLDIDLVSTNLLYMDEDQHTGWCFGKGPDAGWYQMGITNTNNQLLSGLQLTLTVKAPLVIKDRSFYLGNMSSGQRTDIFFFLDYSALRGSAYCNGGDPPLSFQEYVTTTITSVDQTVHGTINKKYAVRAIGMADSGQGGQTLNFSAPGYTYVGQIFTTTVTYRYGNNNSGTSLLAQPTGNASFASDSFRLVGTKVITSTVSGVPVGTTNKFWFPSVSTNNGNVIGMQYYFQTLKEKQSTVSKPWSEITTGQSVRYDDGNYASIKPPPIPPSPPVTTTVEVTKSITPDLLYDGGTATVRIQFKNLGKQSVLINWITENLTPGLTFTGTVDGSQVNPGNSTISPTLGATGTIEWFGQPLVSYSIPASGTQGTGPGVLTLVYTTAVTSQAGVYTTSLQAQIGSVILSQVEDSVRVENRPTAVGLAWFEAMLWGEGARLGWETSNELDMTGFNIYRRSLPNGEWQQQNIDLIMVANPGAIGSQQYEWLDEPLPFGQSYMYLLEIVRVNGEREQTGPAGPVMRLLKFLLPLIIK